ncbi:MAG: ArgR family transcriptional regulator [Alloprevotella sp.]|nr:ArgR family transcriptional regulator [Alloprevotella sp.]
MNQANRLDALRVILSRTAACTQAELLQELAAAGYHISQATLSTDLKKLRASRVRTRRGLEYVLPAEKDYVRPVRVDTLPDYLRNAGILSVSYAGPLVVLHTRGGYAPGIAADLKEQHLPTVAGVVADYDTIFVARADGAEPQQFFNELSDALPALKTVM